MPDTSPDTPTRKPAPPAKPCARRRIRTLYQRTERIPENVLERCRAEADDLHTALNAVDIAARHAERALHCVALQVLPDDAIRAYTVPMLAEIGNLLRQNGPLRLYTRALWEFIEPIHKDVQGGTFAQEVRQ